MPCSPTNPQTPRFVFKKMVECGMPKFSPNKCLHILIADCNFPDCAPYFYNKVRAAFFR